MTVSTTECLIGYTESAATEYPVPFRFLAAEDLRVIRRVGDLDTILDLGSDYSVSGADLELGGTVTIAAPVVGARLIIERVTPELQPTDYVANDRFPAESHERALDRSILIDQETRAIAGRTLQVPVGESGITLPLIDKRKGYYLAFDADGNPIVSIGTGNDAALRTDLAQGTGAALVGIKAAGLSSVSRSALAKMLDIVSVKDAGAAGNNVANDAPAIGGKYADMDPGELVFPNGTYMARPTNTSPYYFGNMPALPVYRGVALTKSNVTLSGYGATVHVKSRTGVTASEVQPIFATDKNMTIGTAEDIGFVGLRFDPENDADATNSNQRFAYMVGVRGLRYLHTRAKSSGARRSYFSHIQNSENILIDGHYHRKVTGGFNFRYSENIVLANSIFDDFSEAIDFDSTAYRVAGGNLVFRSTSRVNQALDINSVQDMALGSIAVHNLGNIFTINYKNTTPLTFDEYVNQPTYVGPPFVPSKNIILSDIVGSAIGNGSAIAGGIGWDWSAGSHAGEAPVRDITLNGSRINDTWFLGCGEARGLVIKDYHWRDVLSPSGFAAFDFRSAGANADQIAWSDLEIDFLDCSVIGSQRGALSISTPKRAVIRNFLQRNANTLGGTVAAMQLSNLHIRAARVIVTGCDIEGNVSINGSAAGIAAWAGDTAYTLNQVRSNGGRYYRVTTAGTSASSGGPTGTGLAIADGTVVWEWLEFPYSILWDDTNRVGGTLTLNGDAHKYIFGRNVQCSLGDVAATGTVRRTAFIAQRRCYIARATVTVAADVAASGSNLRSVLFRSVRSGVTATIAAVNTSAGWTANTQIDGAFASGEPDALLERGDIFFVETSSTGSGAVLTDLAVAFEVIGL
ncbi:hypothetical protein GG804_25640 [Sphingomonas histidinilytica]|uniref:hypothetical protein n=1 Tax=Rhizorhabdus histidinilytica TaxID=439228 RepID=UPI001AD9AEA3|nr:hypothetical protein [Rhizorhabdus histidinilytica]MBO9380155.1 hypothetical protein [Rhizorhabdus histidinilytica]